MCSLSPRDELGLLSEPRLEVFPGHGHLSSLRLHVLSVAVVEAADELQQSDGPVVVDVQPVEDAVGLGRGHLQLRADGEELVPLDAAGVVHVVGAEESAQPVLLLHTHTFDGGKWLAAEKKAFQ